MSQKNKITKLLGIGFLSLVLAVGCGTKNSSSETPSSSESSEPSEVISESSSSSETVKEKEYKVKVGDKEIVLEKVNDEKYSTTFESLTAGTEIKFYMEGVEIGPACGVLGNNLILTKDYKTAVHNNCSNVTLSLFVTTDGAEAWLTGYEVATITTFTAKVNGEDKQVVVNKEATGKVAEIKVTLEIGDVLVIYGDSNPLYIGENAMSYQTEYTAPLPGEYVISVDEYNRLSFVEPTLTVKQLYLTYIDGELIEPKFVTPDNPEDKAQFSIDLKKGQEFVVKYIDGTSLGSGSAVLDCSYTIYINKEGACYPTMGNVKLNITATMDGEPLELEVRPAGDDNFAVYRITVEAGKVIQFFNDGEALKYHDSIETSVTYEEDGIYTIYINKSLQVWDSPYTPVEYQVLTVAATSGLDLSNKVIYVWTWQGSGSGTWCEEPGVINEDGTITVKVPLNDDHFIPVIFNAGTTTPNWDNKVKQTQDFIIEEGATYIPQWK